MVAEEDDPRGDDPETTAPGATGLTERGHGLPLLDRSVGVALLVQLVGYAAILAMVPHGEFASVVEPLQRVPVVLLVVLAVFAIPAVVVALVLGGFLSVLGVQPTTVVVVISTYLVGVAGVWGYREVRGRE